MPRKALSESKRKRNRIFRMNDQDFLMFQRWAKINGFRLSEIIRTGIAYMMREGQVETLLKDPELKSLAIRILNDQFKKNSKTKEMN